VETVAYLAVRVVVGLLLAGLFGFGGYIMSNLFVPPAGAEEHLLVNVRLACVGAGAGLGALAGWFIRDETRPPIVLLAILAFGGGFLGAWAGLEFAEGNLDHYDAWTQHLQVSRTTVFSAAGGANLLTLAGAGLLSWIRRNS